MGGTVSEAARVGRAWTMGVGRSAGRCGTPSCPRGGTSLTGKGRACPPRVASFETGTCLRAAIASTRPQIHDLVCLLPPARRSDPRNVMLGCVVLARSASIATVDDDLFFEDAQSPQDHDEFSDEDVAALAEQWELYHASPAEGDEEGGQATGGQAHRKQESEPYNTI
jgi:hypothetical protein